MAEWSREERYRCIEDVDKKYLENLKQQVKSVKISSNISYST